MARTNTVKRYLGQAWYHIYNRGTNKQPIFFDTKDYWVFRKALRHGAHFTEGSVQIHAFSLLENHFHLLVYQEKPGDISRFMRSAMGKYAAYLREKYHRIGHLYESIFKAKLLNDFDKEAVKKYILANPIQSGLQSWKHVGTHP